MLKYNIDCINPCTSNRSTPYRQCETNTPMASCHETTKCFTKKYISYKTNVAQIGQLHLNYWQKRKKKTLTKARKT